MPDALVEAVAAAVNEDAFADDVGFIAFLR